MSEALVYQRQIADVTLDIRRKTGEFLLTAIEIGRLLFEAFHDETIGRSGAQL